MISLTLVPIGIANGAEQVLQLERNLARVFQLPVRVLSSWFDVELAYDPSRGQYNSTQILERLLSGPVADGDKVLGVTCVDLFIPILTFVFGEAQLGGAAALVSFHRLRNEIYGLPTDHAQFTSRLAKEAIHELGHTFGLVHCADQRCVMRSSTYVEQIDLKSSMFCRSCLMHIRQHRQR